MKRLVLDDGYGYAPFVLTSSEVEELSESISTDAAPGTRRRGGTRNLLANPAIRKWAQSERIRALVASAIGDGSFAARALLFDKSPESNWLVPWHQDLTICVRERIDTPGYGPWSEKAGVVHVQPPMAVLEAMVALRVHLDDCGEDDGPLRILPGTHRRGRIGADGIAEAARSILPVTCLAERGAILLMKPLVLHASSVCARESRRRVLHVEYASCALADGLAWAVA